MNVVGVSCFLGAAAMTDGGEAGKLIGVLQYVALADF